MKEMKNRIQIYNPRAKRWAKLDARTGRVLAVKSDKKPWKRVKKVGGD